MAQVRLSLFAFYREAFLAITDFNFFGTIFRQPVFRTLAYFFWLTLNVSLALTAIHGSTLFPTAQQFLGWAERNFPPLEIRDGKLFMEGEQPLVKKYIADQIYTFVFDTTEKHEPLYKISQPAFVLTRDNLHVLQNEQTQTWRWSVFPSVRMGPKEWTEMNDLLPWVFFPALFLRVVIGASLVGLIQALLLTFFGMSASARHGIRLPYSNYVTIAMYALTPAAAINLIVALTGQYVIYFDLIYLATAAIYTYRATQRCVAPE